MDSSSLCLEWLNPFLSVLPRASDDIFEELWKNKRLTFQDQQAYIDDIDLWSAHVVRAALHENKPLLVVLPDRLPHRPALLFANCLLMDALDAIAFPDIEPNSVIYFGTTIGIREQIASVQVNKLSLDTVFTTYRIARAKTEAVPLRPAKRRYNRERNIASLLPQVICAYAPADPRKVIDTFLPTWLAVDCCDSNRIRWLPSLLDYAEHQYLPVVAWCQNPFTPAVDDFLKAGGLVYQWPKSRFTITLPEVEERDPPPSKLIPLVLNVDHLSLESSLQSAYFALAETTSSLKTDERLLQDALRVGWRYLRALEMLPVPLALFEAEVHQFWGTSTLGQLRLTLERFVEEASKTHLHTVGPLHRAYESLTTAHRELEVHEPPLWTTLRDLCQFADTEARSRLLLFPNNYQRQLFEFALLSRHNLTETELRAKGIWLTTFKSWYQQHVMAERERATQTNAPNDASLQLPFDQLYLPILLGLPARRQTIYIEPLLNQAEAQVLLYRYQQPALMRRVQEWNSLATAEPLQQVKVLERLSRSQVPLEAIPIVTSSITVAESADIAAPSPKIAMPISDTSWESLDAAQELAHLFEDEDEEGATSLTERDSDHADTEVLEAVEAWTETVFELELEDEWVVSFAEDERVQVIVQDKDVHLAERYIRAVRPNDQLLFIVGQQRQNLYDLIINRVHAHPAIELHLAMIRRWHEELPKAYRTWRQQKNRGLDDLLQALQKEGSRIGTTQTLRLWLNGSVLCPEDAHDLKRLARILDMPFVQGNYRYIDKAARRLRGLHIALSRKLNGWLQQEAAGIIGERRTDHSILDKELGLTFSDFRDSLLVLRVLSVREHHGLFLRQSLGQLERREQQ